MKFKSLASIDPIAQAHRQQRVVPNATLTAASKEQEQKLKRLTFLATTQRMQRT